MKKSKRFIIAIDGPSGAGKSTVAKALARRLQGRLLDTGAMYRSVAYYALRKSLFSEREFAELAHELDFKYDTQSHGLLVNGKLLGAALCGEKVSAMASHVSQFEGVRTTLTQKQRRLAKDWARRRPVVVEGRDIGTVVFPKTPYKFFVTAQASVRAKRRYDQLKKQGFEGITLTAILKKHEERDKRDSTRQIAPLRKAKNAHVVDTSKHSVEEVVDRMVKLLRAEK